VQRHLTAVAELAKVAVDRLSRTRYRLALLLICSKVGVATVLGEQWSRARRSPSRERSLCICRVLFACPDLPGVALIFDRGPAVIWQPPSQP
jgi:hypothetical protein